MSYSDINIWNQSITNKRNEINKYQKLSNSLKNTYGEFDSLENYLKTGLNIFELTKIGDVDYKEEIEKIDESINDEYNTIMNIQQAAERKIQELNNEISSLQTKISNEQQRLKRIEQQRKEQERKERERQAQLNTNRGDRVR